MELFWSLIIGVLFAGAIYNILRRSLAKCLFGFLILSHALNLLIFTAGGFKKGAPAFIAVTDKVADPSAITDPLPQALILTAIVIGFAVVAFVIALYQVFYSERKGDDVDAFIQEEIA